MEAGHSLNQAADLAGHVESGKTDPYSPCLQGPNCTVSQRGAVKSGSHSDPLAGQICAHFLAVNTPHPEGNDSRLTGQLRLGIDFNAFDTRQCPDTLGSQTTFVLQNMRCSLALDKAQSFQQSGRTGDIVGASLQTIG